jgi:septum formation protein
MSTAPPPLAPFVYLASQSPRRAQLLEQMRVAHRPLLPDRSEDVEALEEPRSRETPDEYVRRVATLKLMAAERRRAARRLPEAPILAADTTVALGRRLFLKPADADEALAMLRALAGRTHRVLSAVAVAAGTQRHLRLSVSKVRFAEMSEHVLSSYVESGEPMGKAGAYAVQGRIAAWIERIEGSYSGVMGLPLFETRQLLALARVRVG